MDINTDSRTTALAKAREAVAKKRAAGQFRVLDPIEKARNNPKSLRLAINAKCWDCVGAGSDPHPRKEIGNCVMTDCPLYPVRPYQHLFEDVPSGQAL